MRNKPSRPLWKRQMLLSASIAVLGAVAAAPLARASAYEGASASHASTVHLWINGHSVPAAAQSRVIHFPGGVIQVQTVTWGSGGFAGPSQVSMDRQIARMQRLMRVSFGPFAMPSFRLPVPVALFSLPPERAFSEATPRHSMNLAEGPGAAPSVPMASVPGHRILQVRWDRHQTPSPKIPL